MKRKRKLDGALLYMAFAAFVLLSALTITQYFETKELARGQAALMSNQLLFIDVMLLIEKGEDSDVIWKEWNRRVIDGTKLRNTDSGN